MWEKALHVWCVAMRVRGLAIDRVAGSEVVARQLGKKSPLVCNLECVTFFQSFLRRGGRENILLKWYNFSYAEDGRGGLLLWRATATRC